MTNNEIVTNATQLTEREQLMALRYHKLPRIRVASRIALGDDMGLEHFIRFSGWTKGSIDKCWNIVAAGQMAALRMCEEFFV